MAIVISGHPATLNVPLERQTTLRPATGLHAELLVGSIKGRHRVNGTPRAGTLRYPRRTRLMAQHR
jgi:hypothetical protein